MNKQKYNENVELVFEITKSFRSTWKKLGLTDHDLALLKQEIIDFETQNEDPSKRIGPTEDGTGGAIKYRFGIPHEASGKRGGLRIILHVRGRRTYTFIWLFSKSSKASLNDAEKAAIKKTTEALKKKSKI